MSLYRKLNEDWKLVRDIICGDIDGEDFDLPSTSQIREEYSQNNLKSDTISTSLDHEKHRFESLENRWHAADDKISVILVVNTLIVTLAGLTDSLILALVLPFSVFSILLSASVLLLPYMKPLGIDSYTKFASKLHGSEAEYMRLRNYQKIVGFNTEKMERKLKAIRHSVIGTLIAFALIAGFTIGLYLLKLSYLF